MMADNSDDDFVSYGTALEPIEDDEVRRKPVLLGDQVVTDNQGRRRFHGAFTGGFSAGYFNSVGTKEGWTPSVFLSSRGQKTGGQSRQRAEDFMDDEDLGDFGIAPRKIVTTETFTGEDKPQKRPAASTGPSIIPGEHPLQDLIVMNIESIGARLLRKMGWREGQGVGPKVRRRKKKSALSGPISKASTTNDSDGDEENDLYKDFLFAPTDVEEIALRPKDDYHGIGYRGLDPAMAGMGAHVSLFEEKPVYSRSGRHGIAGQAFGVGAFETTDDDIYGMDSMSNYDRVLGGAEPGDSNYGWTAPRGHGKASGAVLENFKASANARPPNKVFSPPVLPKDFRPFHIMEKSSKENRRPQAGAEFKSNRFTLSAPQRAAMLGEEQLPGSSSVFDFFSAEDREKLKSGSSSTQACTPAHPRGQQATKSTPSQFHPAPSPATPDAPTASDSHRLQAFGSGFEPFASNAAKQQRYEEYLAGKKGGKDSDVASSNLTEWERQREAEEFVRAAALYRPLSSLMATRFVTAKQKDNDETVDVPAEEGGDKSEQAKAADLKMFGKLTRDTLEWHPDSLLCKRFNIPNPYPGCSVVGLPTVKKDKFSVFNFLSIAPAADDAALPSSSASEAVKLSRWDKKPALLANVGVSAAEEGGTSDNQKPVDSQATEEAETENRPPMDLFKAIFADSSSSSSEADEEEGAEKETTEGGNKTTNIQEQNHTDDCQIRLPHPSGTDTAKNQHPIGIPTASNGLESPQTTVRNQSGVPTSPMNSESESEEMYGPRLPPPFSVASNQSAGDRGERSGGLPRETSKHRRSKSHRKKKHQSRNSSRHKTSKDKKKSKKNKMKKETKAGHKGHRRSSSRSGHGGQHRTVQDGDYDASGSSPSSDSSQDSS